MKMHVNEACIGCGLCCANCPEVFTMTDAGVAAAIREDIPPEVEDSAMSAKEGCPVDAIEQG